MAVSPAPTSYGFQPGFGAYGVIPNIPSPVDTSRLALGGAVGSLGGVYSLVTGVEGAQAAGMRNALASGIPDYATLLSQSSRNIGSKLRGEIPSDVMSQIAQGAAERGVATGTVGSPNVNAAYLRALGLTSLDLTNMGEQQVSGAVARTPQPPPFSPVPFLPTAESQQAASTLQSELSAAPNPAAAAAANQAAAMSGLRAGMGAGGGAGPSFGGGFGGGPAPLGDVGAGGPAEVGPLGALNPAESPRPQSDVWNDWYKFMESLGPSKTAVPSNQELYDAGIPIEEISNMSDEEKRSRLAQTKAGGSTSTGEEYDMSSAPETLPQEPAFTEEGDY